MPLEFLFIVSADNTYFCLFPNSVLHRGATLTVNVTADGDVFEHVLAFENPGDAASAGLRAGPRHDDEVECPHYLVDSKGTRVGCHFDKLAEPKRTDNYFFLVNGTSKQTAIQFVDFTPFKAVQMEKYNPPANITIRYNGSCHLIRWDNPETRFEMPSHMLCYELDIQRQHTPNPESEEGVGGAAVSAAERLVTSDLCPCAPAGVPEQGFSGPGVAQGALAVGIVALLTMTLMLLCARFSLRRKLFPPVPQVKKELGGSLMPGPQVAWDEDGPPPGWEEPEDILTVEDAPSWASGQAGPVCPASAVDDSDSTGREHRVREERQVLA
ncbi:granulocyte-macrophage colony-stimulating factor receptor subunit alpha-like [Pteropus alecto]|uniref:granulocyte-macrophage colony-stimulating factor receptor subunit alpha-like n=1 Tax=Pteropus alecto TaxID=9402 RepID=UPI000D53342E|nr:granulocyte-macrophage colony-stimulating factor receptor subunit alpha-like [Pteropus alecto]